MDLIQFKAEEIDKVWPLVKDKVQAALDRNYNFRDHKHVKENCKNIDKNLLGYEFTCIDDSEIPEDTFYGTKSYSLEDALNECHDDYGCNSVGCDVSGQDICNLSGATKGKHSIGYTTFLKNI